ncbi:MAG: C39 family peptidase, partial [bacterium]|nr:C39 family peptidase [bacterium]
MQRRLCVYTYTLVAALIVFGAVLFIYARRLSIREFGAERLVGDRAPLPPAQTYHEVSRQQSSPRPSATPTVRVAPQAPPTSPKASNPGSGAAETGVNLDVPFTSQAPLANWELPFKEACEEASLLMVDAYYRGMQLAPQRVADAITRFADFQKARLGYYEDTDAVETALLAREYLHYKNVRVVPGPLTVEMIKKEIAAGRPVIVPAAGRLLGNPYYRQPGPYYHMLVIKGYTDAEFITNDPGTRRGKDFRY